MTLAILTTHIRDWEPNPVLVKELRQAMRSQALTGALMTLLALLFLASVALLAKQSALPDANPLLGRQLCRELLVIMSAVTFLFLPLYVGIRLAAERQESNVDLMFFTALAPRQIIRGKLYCGAYLALMFFSVCTPFLLFTNQLRGVDLPSIALVAVCLYGAVCLAVQAAILFACFPLHPVAKVAAGLLCSLGLVAAGVGLVALLFQLLDKGVQGSVSYWTGFATFLLLMYGGVQLFQSMSVSLLSADSRPRGYFNEVIREAAP
jgi:hypothetical protein